MSSTFIVGIIAFPWIGIGIPFFILFAHLILSYSTRALWETTRLTATSNSPVISYVGESVSGSSTIRAFQKQQAFKEGFFKILNANIWANRVHNAVEIWFGLRVDLLALLI